MRVEIGADGVLLVKSESPMESYALRRWNDENSLKGASCLFIFEKKGDWESAFVKDKEKS